MKIMIVDDHVLFREGLSGILRSRPEFDVIGEAGSVQESIELALHLKPDMILMDWNLPDGDGAQATRSILTELPECKIIFLTVHEADEKLFAAIRSGAKGYLLKNIPSMQLVRTLLDIEAGNPALSRSMTARLMQEFARPSPGDNSQSQVFDALSPREIDVLHELVKGATNREIAYKLFISENTVKHHIHNLLEKLGVENRRQAANLARQHGFE
jgi:DNA-binding NarL/FixJ family response regulator